MRIVIDGNDGTGKTTLVKALRKRGYYAVDRGAPTKLTDGHEHEAKISDDEIYIILDVTVEESRARLRAAGKNLNEPFHTVEDLERYRPRFLEVAKLIPRCTVIDASGSKRETLKRVLAVLPPV